MEANNSNVFVSTEDMQPLSLYLRPWSTLSQPRYNYDPETLLRIATQKYTNFPFPSISSQTNDRMQLIDETKYARISSIRSKK